MHGGRGGFTTVSSSSVIIMIHKGVSRTAYSVPCPPVECAATDLDLPKGIPDLDGWNSWRACWFH